MISPEKLQILTPLQKLPKNVEDLVKLFVAKGFKKLPKVQKIVQSGHTGHIRGLLLSMSLTKNVKFLSFDFFFTTKRFSYQVTSEQLPIHEINLWLEVA